MTQEQKFIYPSDPRNVFTGMAFVSAILLLLVALPVFSGAPPPFCILLFGLTAVLLAIAWSITLQATASLLISDDGITYQQGKKRLFVRWSDIVGIKWVGWNRYKIYTTGGSFSFGGLVPADETARVKESPFSSTRAHNIVAQIMSHSPHATIRPSLISFLNKPLWTRHK